MLLFPRELVRFVRPRELVSFDPWHVTRFPIGGISSGRFNKVIWVTAGANRLFRNARSFENWGIFSNIPQFQLGNIR